MIALLRKTIIFIALTISPFASADIIPCIESTSFGLERLNEVLTFGNTENVHDLSGWETNLVSEECWNKYRMTSPFSKSGFATIFWQPVLLKNGLCKSETVDFALREGNWSRVQEGRRYAVSLESSEACGQRTAREFIFLEYPIEDSTVRLLLQSAAQIYEAYLADEEHVIDGLKLRSIGYTTNWKSETYYSLNFGDQSCTTEQLHVRIDDSGNPEYVGRSTIMC